MSTYVDATSVSVEHCEAMAHHFTDLSGPYYTKFASYCQQKLWHQLTLLMLEFVCELPSAGDVETLRPLPTEFPNTYMALYQKVVLVVASKLNPLSLCRIAAAVAFASWHSGGSNLLEAKQLLQELLTKQEAAGAPGNVATVLYLQSKLGLLSLLGTANAQMPKAELDKIYATLKSDAKLLTQLIPDTPDAMVVNSAHYELGMTYYKAVGPPESFYEEAIQYLNYYQPPADDDATETERRKAHALAMDLCLAALTGEGVYNLGQVVANPILQVLAGTIDAWLVELLNMVARGHVQEFQQLVRVTYKDQISKQPALVNMDVQMEEKVTLLGLVELVFSKPATERTLSFAEIAAALDIAVDQVEWVVMRAFSVKLMEGIMDQVEDGGTVHISWILPRSLGTDQMANLAARFGEWAGKVDKIKEYMQEETAPALMA